MPAGTGGAPAREVVMQHPPGLVTTEPLLDSSESNFSPPAKVEAPVAPPLRPRLESFFPPAPSPNQRGVVMPSDAPRLPIVLADTLNLPPPMPVPQAPSAPLMQAFSQPPGEWTAQLEQLRKDIFSIAMNVSAMNDRIDRLDQRPPQPAEPSPGLASLRTDIESWLQNHLSTAVEHCMHRIMSRVPATAPAAPSAAVTPALPL